jgi:hypothetical protein
MALVYAALGWGGIALLTSLAAATVEVLLANALGADLDDGRDIPDCHAYSLRNGSSMVAPFASVSRAIDTSPERFVIVDNSAAPFGGNLVINQPDLSNRPIRLMASELRASDISDICARGTVAFIKAPVLKPTAEFFGETQEPLSPHVSGLEVVVKDSHCSIVHTPKSPDTQLKAGHP